MKTLYDATLAEEIKRRIVQLRPDSERQWGKMNAGQAAAHLAVSLESALADEPTPRNLLGRIVGGLIKPLALGDDAPMRRNTPTVKSFIVADERDLDAERARLFALIDRFVAGGRAGCTTQPHSFFGRLTADEWGILMYKHLDHHLRQFGA
jgi:hypothetical protein